MAVVTGALLLSQRLFVSAGREACASKFPASMCNGQKSSTRVIIQIEKDEPLMAAVTVALDGTCHQAEKMSEVPGPIFA